MESLPEEVIEVVAQYLSVIELASCCAVSVAWKNMFGICRLWKRHCNKDLVEYLTNTKRAVEPCAEELKVGEAKINSLSEWRLKFLKEACLLSNYEHGFYKINLYPLCGEYEENYPTIFYKNDYLLILKDDKINVWDVKGTPTLCLQFFFKVYPRFSIRLFEITGTDKIVIVQGPIVQVFNLCLTNKRLDLQHLFSFVEPKAFSDYSVEAVQELFKERLTLNNREWCMVVKNIFIGAYIIDSSFTFHIWNVETGNKLKMEEWPCPISKPMLPYFICCEKRMNVIMRVVEVIENLGHKKMTVQYRGYSLKNLAFLPFRVHHDLENTADNAVCHNEDCILFGHFCVISATNLLYVYNYQTCELLFSTFAKGRFLCSMSERIVFVNEGSLIIVNPESRVIEATFNVRVPNMRMQETRIINNCAIFASYSSTEAAASFKIKGVDRAYTYPFYKFYSMQKLLVNNTGTKVIFHDHKHLIVVNFW